MHHPKITNQTRLKKKKKKKENTTAFWTWSEQSTAKAQQKHPSILWDTCRTRSRRCSVEKNTGSVRGETARLCGWVEGRKTDMEQQYRMSACSSWSAHASVITLGGVRLVNSGRDHVLRFNLRDFRASHTQVQPRLDLCLQFEKEKCEKPVVS